MPPASLIAKINASLAFSDVEKRHLVNLLQAKNEYGLVWEDKNELVAERLKNAIPYPIEMPQMRRLAPNAENAPSHLIFEGDNLHSLHILNKTHPQGIDLIYIDPPYNTGNRDFYYNDSYIDSTDQYAHSKWLSFMNRRLLLAKTLLKPSGCIFISIDDNEQARLKLLCDQIFGAQNFVANLVRQNKAGAGHDSDLLAIEYDYLLCYAKDISQVQFSKEIMDVANDKKYKLNDQYEEKRGKYYLRDLDYKGSYSQTLDYPITAPDGSEILSGGKIGKPNTWRWSRKKMEWGIKNDYIVFKKRGEKWKVYIKQYQYVDNNDRPRIRTNPYRALLNFSNAKGSNELKKVLSQNIFSYPKPLQLIQFLLQLFAHQPKLKILDFFAGSGTTLHATLLQNALDGGKRECILATNNENGICEQLTYERNRRVIEGYQTPAGDTVEGLKENNLFYFKTQLQVKTETSVKTAPNMQQPDMAKNLLRLQEGCLLPVSLANQPSGMVVYTNGKQKYLLLTNLPPSNPMLEKISQLLRKKGEVKICHMPITGKNPH